MNNLPDRKHSRLKEYDYSQPGYYFITICTHEKEKIFSQIVGRECAAEKEKSPVGRGLAPADKEQPWHFGHPADENNSQTATIKLTEYGKIAEEELFKLEKRYNGLKINKYVIMPNHIHAIFVIEHTIMANTAGASPRPTTLSDIVCAYKSLTSRRIKEKGKEKVFQTSFYDRVIRGEEEYREKWKYIDDNPAKWLGDEYY